MPFINLHAHTEASIADGLFGPKKWVEALKEKGYKAHAVTDHGAMTSLLPFYKAAKEAKITPIMGVEFYYVDDPMDKGPDNRKASHLILLAKNYEGFKNLCHLSKLSYTDGFYYRSKIGFEWLKKHREGLICTSACMGGVLANEVWGERDGRKIVGLENQYNRFHDLFGEDFYVEFQGHNILKWDEETGEDFKPQEFINRGLYERLKGLPGFKPVVTNDCHYILQEHAKIQKTLKQISWKGTSESSGESSTTSKDSFCDSLWLKSPVQVYDSFRKHHEYLPKAFVAQGMNNTEEIFLKCKDFEMPKGKRYLPTFRPHINSKELFKKLTRAKLGEFLRGDTLRASRKEYINRFKKEFHVITSYNLEDYFLIVWDLVRFAQKRGIYVGLGRGSAAGCLISYLLGIVQIDPLEYKLIFERFLNENRCVSGELPDIDLDFESERRREVKDYIYKTYGSDHVCEIGTYGRMKLKTALIDFAKAMGVATQKEILAITTNLDLDKDEAQSLEAAIESDDVLKKMVMRNLDFAFAVEEINGQIKSQGVHPAGVVICSEPISEITPVKTQTKTLKPEEVEEGGKKTMRIITTQSEDKHVIAQGLMKMDILGIKEYDVIKYVIENAPDCPFTRENYVTEIIGADRIKPNKRVWDMFQAGRTEGVFQFASDGMKELLIMMKPDCINDLVAANALYRPGCLENGWHTLYCRRKHGEEPVDYVHDDVRDALGDTYGVIVFQEQFMEAIHKLGGISLVDTDTIRSALGKKDKDKLHKFQEQFVKGASDRIGEHQAIELWDQIEKASGYSFNRSHSAAYSVLAYISQYLKSYYPAQFWAAQLDWDVKKNKLEDMLANRRAASDMGVEFVLPHVNHSGKRFLAQDGKVVWGLMSVKGIGPKAAEEIASKQPFKDFADFHVRVNKARVKFNNIEALIYAGAFDDFGDRHDLLRQLFSMTKTKGKRYEAPGEEKLLLKFADSMGFFERKIKSLRPFSKTVIDEQELREYMAGDHVRIGGMVSDVRMHKTKKGDLMAFATITDLDEQISVTVFPTILEMGGHKDALKSGNIVEILGKKSGYGGKQNAIEAEKIELR